MSRITVTLDELPSLEEPLRVQIKNTFVEVEEACDGWPLLEANPRRLLTDSVLCTNLAHEAPRFDNRKHVTLAQEEPEAQTPTTVSDSENAGGTSESDNFARYELPEPKPANIVRQQLQEPKQTVFASRPDMPKPDQAPWPNLAGKRAGYMAQAVQSPPPSAFQQSNKPSRVKQTQSGMHTQQIQESIKPPCTNAQVPKFCYQCGFNRDADFLFCARCGIKFHV